ncbi:hypothetical protein PtB15_5B78 [Puccinia triticina]|nr:hypothetical protein PtB15_5B78 [Puccinia triticina]
MVLLTDLPAELLEKILEQVVHLHQADQHHPHRCLEYCPICESDEGSQDIRLKARANLESKQKYHSTFTLPSPTYMTPRATTQALFTHVTLLNQWQAHLFCQTLTSPSLTQNALSSPIDDQHPPASLAHQVRSLQFKFIGPCLMGRGGGSLICEIIRSCPVLENITMATSLLTRCQEPLLDALASRPFIEKVVQGPISDSSSPISKSSTISLTSKIPTTSEPIHTSSASRIQSKESTAAAEPTELLNINTTFVPGDRFNFDSLIISVRDGRPLRRPSSLPAVQGKQDTGIDWLLARVKGDLSDYINTFRTAKAEAAVAAGAKIVNDVSGAEADKAMLPTVARLDVPYVLMHMRGKPCLSGIYWLALLHLEK